MAMLRRYFCAPNTGNTLCAVPILGTAEAEIQWCETNYNATNCTIIRDDAQTQTVNFLWIFYACSSFWGFMLIALVRTLTTCT
jgi:hypothetical protein